MRGVPAHDKQRPMLTPTKRALCWASPALTVRVCLGGWGLHTITFSPVPGREAAGGPRAGIGEGTATATPCLLGSEV